MVSPKKLFLIDATGALISAFFLGVILRRYESTFGMQSDILLFLALLPILFAAYDYYCYFFLKTNWRSYLKGIAIANLIYCCITITLVVFHYQSLTILGLSYFLLELLVIAIIVGAEWRASKAAVEPS
ncbi:hypothetical protein [Maribacter sp. 2308TA10-17]|uniref:hypothetical protein n=1 Tax=Maribacter sp. 2308TA10-17 TaxID=3386276 RepID=UPI0039BD36E2